MAATRYGRIYHSDYSYINLRFQSVDERNTFAEKFKAYHDGHDHDGEVPRFENEVASKIGNPQAVTIHDAHSVSIDGYATYEIEEYHNPDSVIARRGRYKPPTCCVAPIISIDRAFVQSDILTRHELSAVFTDIPEDEFASMLQSVEKDGFIDPIIRLIGTEVLDGWHRYTAAKALNLLRKLKFQQWDDEKEGDPAAFVYARNQHRRHQNAATRAQITVFFNERYGLGTNRYTLNGESNPDVDVPNGTPKPKTREELAKEAGVGVRTIARAIEVDKEGESRAVIRGEKTTGEVIKARDAARLKKRKKQILKNMWDTKKQAHTDYLGDSDTDLNQYLSLDDLREGFAAANESFADAFTSGMKRIDEAVFFETFQKSAFEVDEHGVAKVSIDDLEKENKAIGFYAGDIRQWQRPDWSPDTNWILPLIEAKKKKAEASVGSVSQPNPEPEPVVVIGHYQERANPKFDADLDLKTLREQVKAEMPKWKQRYKETGKQESELVSRASFSALIHVLRNWDEASSAPPEEGAATAEELENLLKYLKGDSYVFIFRLRAYIRETEQPVPDETLPFVATDEEEAEVSEPEEDTTFGNAVKDALNSLNLMWETFAESELGNHILHRDFAVAAAKHYGWYIENDYGSGQNYLMEEDFALLKNLGSVDEVQDWLRRFHNIQTDIQCGAEWVKALVPDSEPESDEDTSLSEVDNLYDWNQRCVVRSMLKSLLNGVDSRTEILTADLYDVFLQYENVPTDKEMVIALLDLADSILSEKIE